MPRPAVAQDGTVDESGLNLLRPLCSRSRNLDQAGVENALVYDDVPDLAFPLGLQSGCRVYFSETPRGRQWCERPGRQL